MVSGVLLGRYVTLPLLAGLLACIILAAVIAAMLWRKGARAAALPAAFFVLGLIIMFSSTWTAAHGLLPELASKKARVWLSGRAVSAPAAVGDGSSFLMQVGSLRTGGRECGCRERVLVSVRESVAESAFYPGRVVECAGKMGSAQKQVGWLLDRGAASVIYVAGKDLKARGQGDPVSRSVHAARAWMSRAYRRLYGPRTAGFIEGVTLSKLEGVDPGILSDLRSCGLSHIVAVSGLHVGSAAMLTLALLTALGTGRTTRYALAGVMAVVVLALSNFRPSALRACLMAGLSFGGLLLGREYDSLAGLSLAGVLILSANPRAVFDMGFQLSFAAALGIVLAVRGREKASGLRLFLTVCAGAQLGILPLMLLKGEGVPVTAVAANLLVVPLVGPLLLSSWAAAFISWPSAPLGRVASAVPAAIARYVLTVASLFSRVPSAGLLLSSLAALALVAYVLALAWTVWEAPSGGSLFRPAAAFLLALALVLVPCAALPGFTSGDRMCILDVGQGDAILLRDSAGCNVLIDGGPDGMRLLEKLRARGVQKLDVILSTHPHSDHVSGLVDVLRHFPVGRVVDAGLSPERGAYGEMLRLARSRKVPRTVAREGMVVTVSERTRLEVLYAPGAPVGGMSDANDSSLVVMVHLNGMRALMTGDLGSDEQKELLAFHPDLSCDVLKVPHHGAREATSGELYEASRPALAAISVGKGNRFGHPSATCIEMLADRRIPVERTDRDGDLEVSVDNGRIGVTKGRR
jgi:competence protein ComEC